MKTTWTKLATHWSNLASIVEAVQIQSSPFSKGELEGVLRARAVHRRCRKIDTRPRSALPQSKAGQRAECNIQAIANLMPLGSSWYCPKN